MIYAVIPAAHSGVSSAPPIDYPKLYELSPGLPVLSTTRSRLPILKSSRGEGGGAGKKRAGCKSNGGPCAYNPRSRESIHRHRARSLKLKRRKKLTLSRTGSPIIILLPAAYIALMTVVRARGPICLRPQRVRVIRDLSLSLPLSLSLSLSLSRLFSTRARVISADADIPFAQYMGIQVCSEKPGEVFAIGDA